MAHASAITHTSSVLSTHAFTSGMADNEHIESTAGIPAQRKALHALNHHRTDSHAFLAWDDLRRRPRVRRTPRLP